MRTRSVVVELALVGLSITYCGGCTVQNMAGGGGSSSTGGQTGSAGTTASGTAGTTIRPIARTTHNVTGVQTDVIICEFVGGGADATGVVAAGATIHLGLTCQRVTGSGGWSLHDTTYGTVVEIQDIST